LSFKQFAIPGALLAALYTLDAMLSGGRLDLGSILLAVLVAGVLAVPFGIVCALLTGALLIRPLYELAARIFVPGFKAYRRFEHAQAVYEKKRAEYESWRRRLALEFWTSLSGREFECECAALFQRIGYSVSLTPGTADGGVDIVLRAGTDVTAVQCKALRGKVGISVGRELVTAAGDFGATRMMIACTSGASEPLLAYAREKGITIVTAADLIEAQLKLEEMRRYA
jgi:hypothetical protein